MGGLNSGLCMGRTSLRGAWLRKLLLVLCVWKKQVLHRDLEGDHSQYFKLRQVCADSPATVVNIQKLTTLRLLRDCSLASQAVVWARSAGQALGRWSRCWGQMALKGQGGAPLLPGHTGGSSRRTRALRRVRMQFECLCTCF